MSTTDQPATVAHLRELAEMREHCVKQASYYEAATFLRESFKSQVAALDAAIAALQERDALTAELTQLRTERDALARDYERIHDCGADVASALGVAMSYDAFANMPQAERTRCANAIDRFAAAEHFINAARDGATGEQTR